MAERSIQDLFRDAFTSEVEHSDFDYADDYLDALRSNLRATGSARLRATIAAVAAAAAFQVIAAKQAKDTIEVAGVSIRDPKYAIAVLPVIFAFQVAIFAVNEVWERVLVVAHRAAMKAAHPAMFDAGVDWLERPIEAVLPSADRARSIAALHGTAARPSGRFHALMNNAGVLVAGAAAVLWLIYAFSWAFNESHHLGLSLASLAAVLFVACFRALPPIVAYWRSRTYLSETHNSGQSGGRPVTGRQP